jgi:hypothetical protein
MRNTRNLCYATEFLERKLSPSSMGLVPVAAQVSTVTHDDPPTYPPCDPIPAPPTVPPIGTGGPTEPCLA